MRGVTKIVTKLGKQYPSYRAPRLADYNGDLSKRWYIDYYVPDQSGNVIRKQYKGMNKFKSLSSRYDHSHYMLKEISKLLKAGYTTEAAIPKPKRQKPPTLISWSNQVYVAKKKELRRRSADYYNLFSKKLKSMPEANICLDKITRSDITKIQTHLIDSGLSPKSVNNHMGVLSSILNMAMDAEFIRNNPFKNIRSLKYDSGKHYPYNSDQLDLIINYLKDKDPQLLLYVSFIYYTLARPNEIRLLKVSDLRNDKICIRAENSKVRKTRYPDIPVHLQTLMQSQNIQQYPGSFYIFGNTGKPSEIPRGTKYFYVQHVKMLKHLNLTDQKYDLYGYKHSGAIALVMAGVDLKFIQNQCGHSNLSQTDQYLKDLGAVRSNQIIIDQYPKIGT